MASEEHLQIIRQGVEVWNDWRQKNPELIPNLSRANLYKANLYKADLGGANLSEANLSEANLRYANFTRADLRGANLSRADLCLAYLIGANLSEAFLSEANLAGANLSKARLIEAKLNGANLSSANLSEANLREANLREANLHGARLIEAKLNGANLRNANLNRADLIGANLSGANLGSALLIQTDLCDASLAESQVYGASVWDIKVNDQTKQQNLIITDTNCDEPVITVDNIEVAQFIYLLLNNQKLRDVIDTITSKAVLILGCFSKDRKPVLDAIRNELRKPEHNYLPIVFDFQPSTNQTTIETIKTLASMARFVIADITDARSVLQELGAIVPAYPSVAVRLLIKKSEHEYGMLDYIRSYKCVVEDTFLYEDIDEVITSIKENVIGPAEAKVKELRQK